MAPMIKWENEQARLANVDSLIARENRMGWFMLQNDHRIIYKGTDSIAIVGVENSGKPPFPDRGDLPKALQGTDGMFKVLLSHDPTHWRRKVLPETRYSLPCQVIPTTCKSACSAFQCPSLSIRNTEVCIWKATGDYTSTLG